MKDEIIYLSAFKCFTKKQAEHYFLNKFSVLNYEILVAHICHPELANLIEGFTEKDGLLYFFIDGKWIKARHNLNHRSFSN